MEMVYGGLSVEMLNYFQNYKGMTMNMPPSDALLSPDMNGQLSYIIYRYLTKGDMSHLT